MTRYTRASRSAGRSINLQVQLAELLRIDRRRGPGHQVHGLDGLRKGDDLADRLFSRQDGDDAVQPERDPPVRRRAVFERLEEESEPELRLLLRHPEQLEDEALQPLIVDPDAAAGDLAAVEDEIV